MVSQPKDVRVRRTELPAPDLTDPNRVIINIEYQIGELPPRVLFINKKDWTKEKEVEMIRADINKRLSPAGEVIKI